jgi:hypothetical protein
MRKALIASALALAALAFAAPASAGCWATVGLAPPPPGTAAGETWTAKITVLQHGRNPLPDADSAVPRITIVNGKGAKETFAAKATDPEAGVYEANVVFPSGGTWRYEVFDGFTSWNGARSRCAQTHTFGAVQIGGSDGASGSAGGSFPMWPFVGGFGALLIGGLAIAYFVRRHGSRAPAPA